MDVVTLATANNDSEESGLEPNLQLDYLVCNKRLLGFRSYSALPLDCCGALPQDLYKRDSVRTSADTLAQLNGCRASIKPQMCIRAC
jgi:hypothetical protein